MALYTTLDAEAFTRLSEAYGLGPVREFTGIPQGSINSNYRLVTASGPLLRAAHHGALGGGSALRGGSAGAAQRVPLSPRRRLRLHARGRSPSWSWRAAG